MAVEQIGASYQNDGNFAELDLQDVRARGPHFRIETFRASQPVGTYGTTAAGSTVDKVAGADHLSAGSNQVFRSIDSVDRNGRQVVILEVRESFDESGAFYVRVRDVDSTSPAYGDTILSAVKPLPRNRYRLSYEIRRPNAVVPHEVISPLSAPISELAGLPDIGGDPAALGMIDGALQGNPMNAEIQWNGPKSEINAAFFPFDQIVQSNARYSQLKANLIFYLRMGDFRDKCIHDGTNLTGPKPALASEFVLVRAYRKSLITMGRIADIDMYKHTMGGMSPMTARIPLTTDPKPGVYTPFLTAYISNVEVYQLGLDKVHL